MNDMDFVKNTIVITNRKLVKGDYLAQIERVAKLKPKAIILREKELSREEYRILAEQVQSICAQNGVEMFVHSDVETATEIGAKSIHLSVNNAIGLHNVANDKNYVNQLSRFDSLSISCHSLEDVKQAIECGATQIVLGTIFETECKKGLEGRGLDFVKEITDYCKDHGGIPVFAIGGIKPDNIGTVIDSGAAGGCMMSYMMEYGN